jgi:ribosomal-protein-alanine N-acetyltransferase
MIFQIKHLFVRKLENRDDNLFFELMGNPNVMNPIPRKVLTKRQSSERLEEFITLEKTANNLIWCLTLKNNSDLIGICGFVKNEQNEYEIAYSILEKHWGNGYGTEIAKELICYGFQNLGFNKIFAEVNTKNTNSIKILDKLMTPISDSINNKDNCIDRLYKLEKQNWGINN